MSTSTISTLPLQTIDFSVSNPQQTNNLSLPLYQGAGYREEYKTWSLLHSGGFMKFNLQVDQAIDVCWEMSVCASLVDGKANCPISITVNGKTFVSSYNDTNPHFHSVSWTIPANMLKAGGNEVVVSLDKSASTQLFINGVTVQQAVLLPQTIDFSVSDPKATANYSLPSYRGAGYRADFKTWSLLQNGGFMNFNLQLSDPVDIALSYGICSALVSGVANSPASVTVNGKAFWSMDPKNANFQTVTHTIPASMLVSGANAIIISLDSTATGQLFINASGVAQA